MNLLHARRAAVAKPGQLSRRLFVLLLGTAAFLFVGVAAWAFWSSLGTGAGAATTATLNAPSGVLVSTTGGSSTVAVSWTASTTAGGAVSPAGYYVTRTSGSVTTSACGTSASSLILAPTSCSDTSVPDGSYTYAVTAVRNSWTARSASSSSVAVASDLTPPAVSVTSPANNGYTKTTTPTFSGTAGTAAGDLSAVTVKVFAGSSAAGTPVQSLPTTANAGTWSVSPSPELTGNAQYTLQASQSDSAGNTGTATSTFVVDTTAPGVTVTAPAAGSVLTTATPSITGAAGNAAATATASADASTVTVRVYSGGTATGTPVQTVTPNGSTGSYSATLSALVNGTYTVQSTQSDGAGNTGTSSAVTFSVSLAPGVTVTSPAPGSYTKSTTPLISGAAGNAAGDSATVTVKIYSGSTTGGTLVQTLTPTRSGGTWSATPSPALAGNAQYTVQATQSNSGGTLGTSNTSTFVVDTTPPGVTVTAPAAGSVLTTATPSITGAAGNAAATATASADASTVTVRVYSGGTATGTPVQTVTPNGSTGSYSATLSALVNGTYTVQSTQSDGAGNTGTSSAVTFSVSLAPGVTVTSPAPGSYTNSTTPLISGAAGNAAGDSATVTVKIYSGSTTGGTLVQTLTPTRSGGTWSATPSPALAGNAQYTVQATQSNSGGTLGTSNTSTFVVDTTPPLVTVTSPTAKSGSGGTIAGTLGTSGPNTTGSADAASVTLTIRDSSNAVVVGPVTVAGSNGVWSYRYSGVQNNKSYTATVVQVDAAGNTSTATVSWTQ